MQIKKAPIGAFLIMVRRAGFEVFHKVTAYESGIMNTKGRGDMAVGQAICHFISLGYEVCLPVGDKRDYDFVIEKNGQLEKVQVKFAGLYKGGQCKVGLRITGGNQSFSYAKKYADNSFDLLFVYTQKGDKYLIPWKGLKLRNEISIEHLKYKTYKV